MEQGSGIDTTKQTEGRKIIPPSIDKIPTIGGGLPFEQKKLPNKEESIKKLDLGLTKNQLDTKFPNKYISDDYDKKLLAQQGISDKIGNTTGRIVTDFLGGTIESIGSIPAVVKSLTDEIQGKDAEFTNSIMDIGKSIQEYGKEALPLYKQNPGKSWDVKDPSWWFEGVESAASTLQFLLGTGATAKAFSGLADITKLSKGLTKLGLNGEKIASIVPRVAAAVFARNAENLQSSYDDKKNVQTALLSEWSKNPDAFEEAKNGEAAQELLSKGKELTKENLANHIGSKAGWKSYMINSANIGFDYIELAPMFKGNFNYKTRLGKLETPTNVLEAQNLALGKNLNKITKLDKAFDYLNPMIGTVGRNLTEGIEEGVNYISSEEAKNYSEELQGKNTPTLTNRLHKYIKSGDFYENMFWGTLGGTIGQGLSPAIGKAYSLIKGDKSNTETDYRISEIQGRQDLISKASEQVAEISKQDIPDEDKKQAINQIKSELSLDLGTRAAQAGNVHLLIQQMSDVNFRDNLVKNGIAEEKDIEKATAKSIEDVLTAEKLYKKYYNSFQSANTNDFVRNHLINQSITADFLIHKNNEKISNISKEVEELKSHDAYISSTSDTQVENTIQLKALQAAKETLNSFLKSSKDEILSTRGKKEIENIDAEIKKIEGFIDRKEASLKGINPDIISKHTQIILGKGVSNINAERIASFRNPENISKDTEKFNEIKNNIREEDLKSFKDKIDNEIKENKHTSTTLNELKEQNKDNPTKVSYLQNKIKIFTNKEKKDAREKSVKEAREKIQKGDISISPINQDVEDEFEDIPQHTIIDAKNINPTYKNVIDELYSNKDITQLRGFIGEGFEGTNPNEALYAKNKVQELRNERDNNKNIVNVNSPIENNSEIAEFDENAQVELPKSKNTLNNLQKQEDNNEEAPLVFDLKVKGEDSTRCGILPFGILKFEDFGRIENGNIIIRDEYKEPISILMDKDFTYGSEIEIIIDKKNSQYDFNKTDFSNVPLGIYYKGKHTTAFVGTVRGVKDAIQTATNNKNEELVNKLKLDLLEIQKIRKQIGLSERPFKSKVIQKGNGTVISSGFNKKALKSCKGIFTDFYYLSKGNNYSLINSKNETDIIGSGKEYRQGIIYGGLQDANGNNIPVPLFVSQLNLQDASKVQENIGKLMNLIDTDNVQANFQNIDKIEKELRKYIQVDTTERIKDGKPTSFRYFKKSEEHEARIEFSFYDKGQKYHAIIKKDKNSVLDSFYFNIVKKNKDGSDEWIKNPKNDKLLYSRSIDSSKFLQILQKKYYNVDFQKMKQQSYIDHLINNEIIKTDIAQVTDSKGNVISNLFGFKNDFDLYVASDLDIEKKEEQIIDKDKEDLLSIMKQETPFLVSKNQSIEEFNNKYNIFKLVSTTTANTLDEISNNAQGEDIKYLSDWLRPLVYKNPSSAKLEKLPKNTRGSYITNDNTIRINKDNIKSEENFQRTFLHESLHSLTINQLLKYLQIKKSVVSSDKWSSYSNFDNLIYRENTPQYIKDFVNSIFKDYKDIKDKISIKNYEQDDIYGLENIFEFISEITSNPKFRNIIQDNTDIGFFGRLYNNIIEFLNKVLKLNLDTIQKKKINETINNIRQFIEKSNNIELQKNFSINTFYSKFDPFKGDLSIEDVHKLTTYFQNVILATERKTNEDFSSERLSDFKDKFKQGFNSLKNLVTPEQSSNIDNVLKHYDDLFKLALEQLDRKYKTNSFYDIIEQELAEDVLEKDWDSNAANQISSQDTITKEIKKFVETIPYISGIDVEFEGDNIKNYKVTKDNKFGITQYLDFNSVYPYMVRNLMGTTTGAEIINKLKTLSKIQIPNSNLPYGSFAYMANQLEKDHKLLTQFIVNLGSKYTYDSYVVFFTNSESLEARIDNENKKNNPYIQIGNQWVESTNNIIDYYKENPSGLDNYKERLDSLKRQILVSSKDFPNNKELLSLKVFEYSNELGVGLSIPSIKSKLDSINKWGEFTITNTLDLISDSIVKLKSNSNFGNLNTLAKLETIYHIDRAENTVMSIDGKPLYAVRNPNYLSNFFNFLHSNSNEGIKKVEEYLKNISTIPELQYSNWLWKFINYDETNGNKTFKSVNHNNLEKFKFHNFGGAKEVLSKEVQKYHEFTDEDWKLINIINYYKNTTKDFALYPGLIPSDSSTIFLVEAPKTQLRNEDLKDILSAKGNIKGKIINENSQIFNQLLNINLQEVRRIQQAYQTIFELNEDENLKIKDNLNSDILIANYHYDPKKLSFNEDGTINKEKTLLANGKPTGKAFYFQNQLIGNKRLDSYDIKLNNHLFINEVSQDVLNNIKEFTKKSANQLISEGIRDYKELEENISKTLGATHKDFMTTISEYMLNLHINYVEQTNLLQGNLSYYKNVIDATKRHKQTNAPGDSYSSEAMKMKRKNGSWCDGETFNVSIIKDIERSSKELDELKKYTQSLDYGKINAGDAQGYMTLDRYEQLLRGRGRFDDYYDKLFKSIRSGKQIERNDLKRLKNGLKTLQPYKNFYYGLHYDNSLQTLVPKQLKYSTIVLIPQLVKDTHLETLMNTLEEKGIDELVFESGSKVGSQQIYKIDSKGELNSNLLSKLQSTSYYNKNLLLQLEIPEHTVDAQNRLATQISKLIISNIPDNTNYQIGDRTLKGKELKEFYFKVLTANINQSAKDLLKDLDINFNDETNNYEINYNKLSEILKEEVKSRGLSENYNFALDVENNNFKMPLFMNNMDKKWQAILTSLFTNRILKQKLPGLSAVQASGLFIDKLEQSQYNITGINWHKDKENDHTLKVFDTNGVKTVECIVGRWNSKFFKGGEAIDINEISSDILEMIGYRIPTDSKHSMIMLKVVGFLPEESKGLIITPDDIITQTGSDFDIDKLFLITKNISNKLEAIKYEDSTNYDDKQLKNLHNRLSGKYIIDKYIKEISKAKDNNDSEATKLAQAILFADEEFDSDKIIDEIQENEQFRKLNEKYNSFPSFEDWKQLTPEERISTKERQNLIFDIYKGILTNKEHLEEIINPSNFDDFKEISNWFNEIKGNSDDNINVLSDKGQRLIRKRNTSGIALKGIAANLNAFGAVTQHTKMYLSNGFKFSYKINDNKLELEARYKDNIKFEKREDGEYALINFQNLGYSPNGDFKNVKGKLILDTATQGLNASLDAAKEPTLEAINATTYTYPLMHTMELSGTDVNIAALFIGQPIMVNLNNYYFQQKSLLGDTSGKEVETIKKWYQTYLLYELKEQGKKFDNKDIQKLFKRRKDNGITLEDKEYLIYLKRENTKEILGYNPNEEIYFSEEDLKKNIEMQSKGISKLSPEERVKYFTNQLHIIEHFGRYRKNSQSLQDILRASKTDSIGAGPTLNTTTELDNQIENLRENTDILIDENPAINKLFPLEDESVYSPITSYYNNVNVLSYNVLNNQFISESNIYREFKNYIKSITSIKEDDSINKFLNTILLQDFNSFKSLSKENIIGVDSKVNENINISLQEFKDLSTANKVYILKEKQKDYLQNNPMNILNFLNPRLNKSDISDNGYHKLDILFYKNEFTDDALIQNLVELYKEGDQFEQELVKDLINYSAITNGLFFGLNSFSKIIPNEILYELGIGDYMYEKNIELKDKQNFDYQSIDLFFRNNWNNNSIVPSVKTQWLRKKNDKGKYEIIKDKDGFNKTQENTPIWIDNDGIITIEEKTLQNVSFKIKNAPYILINNKEGNKLYKKQLNQDIGLVYYYQVNKLGKDGIIETTNNSIFDDNNSSLGNLEETVFELLTGAKIDKSVNPDIPSMFRHGETKQDSIGQNSGWNEISISNEGKEQAIKKGNIMKEEGIKTIITSPTYRAQQTAKIASEISGAKIITNDLLKSWNLGDFESKPETEFDEAYYINNPDVKTPNGESFNTFKDRVIKSMESINYDSKTVVLTHSKVMSLWRALVNAKGWNEQSKLEFLKDKDYQDKIIKQLDNILIPKEDNKDIFNTPEDKQDDITKNCGYGY